MVTFTQKINFLRRIFGSYDLDRKKQNAIFSCPSCGGETHKKKFYINLDTWQCHCWSCNLRGKTILSVLRKYGTKSDVESFMSHIGIKDREFSSLKSESQDEIERIRLPENFILLADSQRSIDPDIRGCIKYLRSRGLSERDLWRYRFGTVTRGRFKRRVIIPSFDSFGDLNFFVSRAIDDSARRKYINSNNNKKFIIFNEIDIDWSRELTLVEGPFDMVKAGENATCILGSSLRDDYLLFSRIVSNETPILLALDSDMKSKEQEIAMQLNSYGCQVRVMDLGGFSDVGSMTRDDFINLKNNSKEWNPSQRLKMRIGALRSGSLL